MTPRRFDIGINLGTAPPYLEPDLQGSRANTRRLRELQSGQTGGSSTGISVPGNTAPEQSNSETRAPQGTTSQPLINHTTSNITGFAPPESGDQEDSSLSDLDTKSSGHPTPKDTLLQTSPAPAPPIKMPPMPGQKGTGKKGRDPRQSRSRNTTPSLVGASSSAASSDTGRTPYTQIPINLLRTPVADEIADQNASTIPNSRELEALMQRMERLAASVDERAAVYDKGMRVLAQARKDRHEELEIEKREKDLEERKKRDLADEEERGRHKAHKFKKRKDSSRAREERPLTHGAHGLAPQDGSSNLGMLLFDMIFHGDSITYHRISLTLFTFRGRRSKPRLYT